MKQIEAYVEEVYQGVGGNKKEINESKKEMKSHLLEAVHELKQEGKSEKEAIQLAIERFGGEQEMRSIVGQLFKAQRIFANWILYLAITVLLLSIVAFVLISAYENENASENSEVATAVHEVLRSQSSLTDSMKTEIAALIDGTDQISEIKIYNVSGVGINSVFGYVENAKPEYQYSKSVWSPDWLLANFYPYGSGGGNKWYVEMETRLIGSWMGIILFSGLAIYATLFTIWATINAYHHKRLNVAWIIAFAFFNIIGYLVYILVGKRSVNIN
ncbi:permease prefix domain 1-containing protein [Planococcus sp. S3-L1]|uniref:permease prefix domain 1-containing protein n=1 Tax=Planococcus sp. S3-L1 TaxID=3046200 RepID=UPI0024B8CEDE|nr:permease prefix domain 1-containing protein [Planococcus sp. S3-L1]MDJ0333451.1 permease prefix domain 1-containing protein [Planococcus sp. S3-L1]